MEKQEASAAQNGQQDEQNNGKKLISLRLNGAFFRLLPVVRRLRLWRLLGGDGNSLIVAGVRYAVVRRLC